MVSKWKTAKLTDHYEIRSGLSKPAKDFGSGYPFLTFKDVFYNYFTPEKLGDLVESTEKDRLGCSVLRGDVFLTRTSETMNELGMSCVALKDYENSTFNGFCKRLRPKADSELVPEYVGYYLRSPLFRRSMMAFSTMSTRASLNNEMISRLDISYPDPDEQVEIARVLKTLDEKISLNNQINQTLEQMAQTLFKSWFVDFDPVIDNGLDAGRYIPEVFEPLVERRRAVRESADFKPLPDDVRQLFPSEFEESELGWVPTGWAKGSLAEQISLIGGGTPKRSNNEFWGGQIPWFSVKDAPSSSDVFVIDTDEKITELGLNGSSTKLLPLGTTIISARGTVGKLALVGCEMAMNQSCYGVQPKDQQSFSFNYFNLKHAIKTLQQNTHGAVFDTITKNTFDTVEAVIPPQIVLDAFESYSTVWLEKIKSNLTTSASLTKLRDTLLPKLISGELRLDSPEFEQAKALVE